MKAGSEKAALSLLSQASLPPEFLPAQASWSHGDAGWPGESFPRSVAVEGTWGLLPCVPRASAPLSFAFPGASHAGHARKHPTWVPRLSLSCSPHTRTINLSAPNTYSKI